MGKIQPRNLEMPAPAEKKSAIKIFLLIIIVMIITIFSYYFISNDKDYAGIFVALAVVIPLMIVSGMYGYKNRESINSSKGKFWYILLIIGILDVLFFSASIYFYGGNYSSILQIGVGVIFIIISVTKIKNR